MWNVLKGLRGALETKPLATAQMRADEREVLLEWIKHSCPHLQNDLGVAWSGRKPAVFSVFLWASRSGQAWYCLECVHGYRGGLQFCSWNTLDDVKRILAVPECPKCLGMAKRWHAFRSASRWSERMVQSTTDILKRRVKDIQSVMVTILISLLIGLLILLYENEFLKLKQYLP